MLQWWLLLIFSAVACVAFTGLVFPRVFFREGFQYAGSADRGLKNYREDKGRSIVYQPKAEYKKFVNQYILSEREGKKGIICKIEEHIFCLDYSIVLFGERGKVIGVININDKIQKKGFTCIVEVPIQTAYAMIEVNAVNNEKIDKPPLKISKSRLLFFAAVTGATVAAGVFCARLCVARLFGDVFAADFLGSVGGIIVSLILTVAASLLSTVIALRDIFSRKRERQS